MADPENLVLSILREMRSEMSEFRHVVESRFDGVDRRFDAVEVRLELGGDQNRWARHPAGERVRAPVPRGLRAQRPRRRAELDPGLTPVYDGVMPFADIYRRSSRRHAGACVARWTANAALAPLSWFRAGGPAQVLFAPADEEDLALFFTVLPSEIPWFVIGLGSNLLVRDGGVEGVVIRLGKGFGAIDVDGLTVTAGAGAPDVKVARAAAEAGIAGMAFLRGSGAVGGALRMNGGAYGGETKDIFVSARGVRRDGSLVELHRPTWYSPTGNAAPRRISSSPRQYSRAARRSGDDPARDASDHRRAVVPRSR